MEIGSIDDPRTCPRCWRVTFESIAPAICLLHQSPQTCSTRQCARCLFFCSEHVARSLLMAEQTKSMLREKRGDPQA